MKLGSLLAKGLTILALVWPMCSDSFADFRWTGWREVPGGGVTSRPVSGVWFKAEKLLYVFHTGDDGRIYYQTTFKTFFSGWIEVPGAGATDADVSATIWTNDTTDVSDDGIYLFARGTDGTIYVNTKPAFGAWSGWYSFASHPQLAAGLGPVAQTDTASCDGIDSLNVFFTSIGGTDWYLQYCRLAGGWTLKPAPSILNVGRMGCTGINEIIVTGNEGIVYKYPLYRPFLPVDVCNYAATNWMALPGVYSDVPPVGAQWSPYDPCETSYVYVCKERGTDQLFYEFSSGSPEETSWREIPGGGRTDAAPGAAAMKIGRVEVIVVMVKGTDHRIYWNIAKNRRSL